MSQQGFSAENVTLAARQALTEIFGESSPIVDALAAKMVGNLTLSGADVNEPSNPESYVGDNQPRYTERVLRSTSAREVYEIAQEAAERLSLSISSYLNELSSSESVEPGSYHLRPWVFPEGAHSGEGPLLGSMVFKVRPLAANSGELEYNYPTKKHERDLLVLRLEGGEHAPFDYHDADSKNSPRFEQHLYVRQGFATDSTTGEEYPMAYLSSWSGYVDPKHGPMNSKDEIIGGDKSTNVMANIFWALDTAINYYENVYQAGYKVAELSYSAWREAGCLGDDGKVNYEKAGAYLTSLKAEGETSWPKVGDYESTVLVIDSDYKDSIEPKKRNLARW